MANRSLDDFFAAGHSCSNWTLLKAVYLCTWRAHRAADGCVQSAPARASRQINQARKVMVSRENQERQRRLARHKWNTMLVILQEKARRWDPETFFHQTLQKIMLAPDLKTLEKMMLVYNKGPFTQNQVVPATTYMRKQLEAWMYANSAPPASPREQQLAHLHEQIRRLEELHAFEAGRMRKLTRLRDQANDADEYIELDRQLQSAIAMEQTHAIGLDRARTRVRELETKKKVKK